NAFSGSSGQIWVPANFTGGSITTSTIVIPNTSFADINVTQGMIASVTFTTATGGDTINFGAGIVPEPSTYAILAGLAVLGFVALRRRRKD
ncbi:MAG: PEP-CTERM sorting domain-containing protein, partial [Puniceicoccales bacterium]